MELHSHKDTIDGIADSHPKLGLFILATGFIAGFFSISFEQTLNDINLIMSIFTKCLMPISILITIVIYWDKITANLRQMKEDAKEKFQRKK